MQAYGKPREFAGRKGWDRDGVSRHGATPRPASVGDPVAGEIGQVFKLARIVHGRS